MNSEKVRLISELKSQRISVGILASDWLNLKQTLSVLDKHRLNLLHFDIADGHFSPLFTVGAIAVKQFSAPFFKDVHLMVEHPFPVVKECVKAGADIITLQIETGKDLNAVYDWINAQERTVLCGLGICPATDLNLLFPYLEKIDLIQVLTLDPRTGIKAHEEEIINRISQLSERLREAGQPKIISVDGSMTLTLAKKLVPLGIDLVVSGSALFASAQLDETLNRWTRELFRTE